MGRWIQNDSHNVILRMFTSSKQEWDCLRWTWNLTKAAWAEDSEWRRGYTPFFSLAGELVLLFILQRCQRLSCNTGVDHWCLELRCRPIFWLKGLILCHKGVNHWCPKLRCRPLLWSLNPLPLLGLDSCSLCWNCLYWWHSIKQFIFGFTEDAIHWTG